MRTTCDTRFAGTISTETGVFDETSPVVIVTANGIQIDLFPDEAVRVAVRLIETAARAERNDPDDWTDQA